MTDGTLATVLKNVDFRSRPRQETRVANRTYLDSATARLLARAHELLTQTQDAALATHQALTSSRALQAKRRGDLQDAPLARHELTRPVAERYRLVSRILTLRT